jgi:adenosylhomocysteine nucleosidase
LTPDVVGIVCALQSEARHLGPATRRAESIATLADGSLLHVSGMGGQAASLGASMLADAGAGALVSWGMAGGLDPSLAPGTLVLPVEVVATNGSGIETSRAWRERASTALRARHPSVQGRLLSCSHAIGSVAEKAALFKQTGAVAVDMESLAVGEVAMSRNLPFLAVRVIVDSALDALPRAVSAAADAAGQLHIWRLLGALALAPGDLGSLVRLAKCYRAAGRALASVADRGLLASGAFPLDADRSPRATVP